MTFMLVLLPTVKMIQMRTVMTTHDKLEFDDDDEDDEDDDDDDEDDDDGDGDDKAGKENPQIFNMVSRTSCFDHVSVVS